MNRVEFEFRPTHIDVGWLKRPPFPKILKVTYNRLSMDTAGKSTLKLLDLPSFKVTPKAPDHDQPDNATQSREIFRTHGEGIPICFHHTNVWGTIIFVIFLSNHSKSWQMY